MPTGYTPIYKIMKGGDDITARFNDRTIDIKVELVAGGGDTDKCTIKVDDRDWKIATPTTGDYLEIYMGYEEVGLAYLGSYEVDDIIYSGPPRTIQLVCLATGAKSILKAPTIKNFDNKSVGDILGGIAGKAGLGLAISPELAGKKLPFKNQIVSPNHLIHELERMFGAVGKVADGKLTFTPRDGLESVTGQSLPTLILWPEHFGEWQVRHTSRTQYGKVRAAYHDKTSHVRKWVESAASGESPSNQGLESFAIGQLFNSKEEAEAAAASRMKALKRGEVTASFTLAKGDPWIRDQQSLLVNGMRDGIDGSYVVEKAIHTYVKRTGIKSTLECKSPGTGDNFADRATEDFLTTEPGQLMGEALRDGIAPL